MLTVGTLLVAVDFSDTTTEVAEYGRELARSFGAGVHLLHVVPDPLQQPWAVEAPGLDFPGLSDQWRAEARERLHTLATQVGLGERTTVLAVAAGVPHRAIVEYAAEHHANIIVLGSHGHGPVVHFLLGSVAERVVRQAVCPVLIVPHARLRSTPPATPLTSSGLDT
jgi:nucleotide-binding universal stress UspA family protein